MTINLVQNPADGSASFADSFTGREIARFHPEYGLLNGFAGYTRVFDDFYGDVIADQWSAAKGSDGQGIIATVVSGAAGGVVRLTSGDVGTGTAADGSVLTHSLNWKANQGGLYMEARLKLNTSVASVCVNIGFTDVLATTTLEAPFTVSGTTITSAATDAACLVFDTAQTTDIFNLIGVKNNTDTALTATSNSFAPTADTYATYGIYIDTAGSATAFINGAKVATVANAVTATVALTPVISIETRTTAIKEVDIDYIFVNALRA
jgi:hypothetical protein